LEVETIIRKEKKGVEPILIIAEEILITPSPNGEKVGLEEQEGGRKRNHESFVPEGKFRFLGKKKEPAPLKRSPRKGGKRRGKT